MWGLALSFLNSAAIAALWVFYLSKHFSTHKVRVIDIKKTAQQKKPVESVDIEEEDEEEARLRDFATSTTAKLFNRTKERLTDSLL